MIKINIVFTNEKEYSFEIRKESDFSYKKRFNNDRILVNNDNCKEKLYLMDVYDNIINAYEDDIDPLNQFIIKTIEVFKDDNLLLSLGDSFFVAYDFSAKNMEELLFFEKEIK